ncbi:hypothetical protein BCR44DRAFT_46045 [Catenaria anguillulae PL171]|uniref:Uncharacterized protein n=1 Tax=Catenaria anguillulae PL171 TaxID=765915 RepID=A0A1Y2I5M0_9FUNG|nr:hypothetical protein BCR44DRAFT_46045 [Catenaria anguillulae PL171]
MSDPSLNSSTAARRLWSHHTQDPADTSILDKDFSLLMLPTCAGAQSVDEYKRFYRKYMWAAETNGYFVKKQVLQTHYSPTSIVEEAMYDVHLHEGREDQMQWIVPGVKLNEPGERKVATVVVVTVVNVAAEQGVLLSKRVYWDQASVLKQLGLIQAAGNPSTYGFHANYLLPALGTPHDKLLSGERDLPFNIFALRLEDTQPMSKNTSNDSMSSLLSGTSTPLPVKHGIRLVPGASETAKHSHIFDAVELPKNAFSGMKTNPKKYETHLAIIGSGAEQAQSVSRDRSRSPSAGPKSSSKLVDGLYDPLTGDLVRPNVHDPQRHTSHVSNVVFGSGSGSADDQDDDGDVFAMHHKNKKHGVVPKHLESTLDKVLAGSLSTDTDDSETSASRGRSVPRHLQSHFNAGLAPPENTRSEEELYIKTHPGSGKPPAHMATTLDAPLPAPVVKPDPHFQATLGNPEAEAQWIPGKNKKPNPAMQATSLEEEEQRARAASPKRAPRPIMETTLDKDAKGPMRKAKPDLVGHDVFGTGAPQEEQKPVRTPIKRQYMESHITFGSGDVAAQTQAQSQSPKSAKPHLKSNVFGSVEDADKQPVSPARRSYAEHGMTKSQVKLGDDGGVMGMPPSVPTWGATASVPVASDKRPVSSKRQGPGGHSTLRLG